MREVALGAVHGDDPSRATLARFDRLAAADPLAPEPYLARGAIAARRGNYGRAEALLIHARSLDPREPSARFLLADLYLRQDRAMQAIAEMSALNRLVSAGSIPLTEAIAQYAAKARAISEVRAILSAYPELEDPVLRQLARNPRNLELILSLHRSSRPRREPPPWLQGLIASLIDAGEYRRAFGVWRQLTGTAASPGEIFNPRFNESSAPPPFNWSLAKGSSAVVEASSGGLNVLYFGREDVTLAEQLLILGPGRYRIAMNLSGDTGENDIVWSAECVPGHEKKLLDLPIGGVRAAATVSTEFNVPGHCGALRLQLVARSGEFPKRADFRIGSLGLAKTRDR